MQALMSASMPMQRLLKAAALEMRATKTLAPAFDGAREVLRESDGTLAADHSETNKIGRENANVERESM